MAADAEAELEQALDTTVVLQLVQGRMGSVAVRGVEVVFVGWWLQLWAAKKVAK